MGWPTCSRACARGEAGRRLRSLGFTSRAARSQAAATVPLSPPGQPGHDRPQERGCGFWMGEGHRRDGMVALGRRTPLLPGRRTQSAFGHVRLDLVLLYFRCRSTADHGNRSGSTHTDIPEPSLTVSGLGISLRRALSPEFAAAALAVFIAWRGRPMIPTGARDGTRADECVRSTAPPAIFFVRNSSELWGSRERLPASTSALPHLTPA